MNISKIVFPVFIIILSIVAMKSLWGPQFYTSHDGQSHLARLYQYDLMLKEGQIPPRWAGQFNGERGSPVFIFTYPFPYWIGEIFHIAGLNLAESVKLEFGLFYLLSGLFMYLLAKELFKSKWAALVTTVLWLWAPYRFVKIYVTASLGESVAFTFIPLIAFFIYRLISKPKKIYIAGLALSTAGLILTHLITLIIFLPFFILFAWWCLEKSSKKAMAMKLLILCVIAAAGLSAFYLLPAVGEKQFTQFNTIVSREYFKQFVEFRKLLYSPWGYGAPKFGPNELSLQVGMAQWLAVASFLILSVLFLLVWKKKIKPDFFYLGQLLFITFVLSIFLMLSISKPVWDFIKPLQAVDTPWRFLSLSVFSGSLISGWIIRVLRKRFVLVSFLVGSALIALALFNNRNYVRINEVLDHPDSYFKTYYWIGSGWDEYRPKWLNDTFHKPPRQLIEQNGTSCIFDIKNRQGNLIVADANCTQETKLTVNIAYFPGWKISVFGADKTGEVINNLGKSNGLVLFNVPKGESNLQIYFTETKLRLIANIISFITIVSMIIIQYKIWIK